MAYKPAQAAVAEYHDQMLAQHGHDMHEFHADWHRWNRDPRPPSSPTRDWGAEHAFGTDFLQMHHEMIKAEDDEPKFHMHHGSIVSWYHANDYDLPSLWNPLTPIPDELAFDPTPPTRAFGDGSTLDLRRSTDDPRFSLPRYFSTEGVGPGENGEPLTGARKLADFVNANQLGCCIVYPHNLWHGRIGGAMLTFETALDDPIFYFGVHWHIDLVFDDFKRILALRDLQPLEPGGVPDPQLTPTPGLAAPAQFSPEQRQELADALHLGEILRRPTR